MAAPITLEDLNSLLGDLFPVRGGLCSLELAEPAAVFRVPAGPRELEDGLRITLRLIVWDRIEDSAELTIRDVKEQQVYFGPASLLQRGERLAAFCRGSCAALQQVLESNPEIDVLMPHELWLSTVLKLAKAQTADDFCRALLTKGRLGAYLKRA